MGGSCIDIFAQSKVLRQVGADKLQLVHIVDQLVSGQQAGGDTGGKISRGSQCGRVVIDIDRCANSGQVDRVTHKSYRPITGAAAVSMQLKIRPIASSGYRASDTNVAARLYNN